MPSVRRTKAASWCMVAWCMVAWIVVAAALVGCGSGPSTSTAADAGSPTTVASMTPTGTAAIDAGQDPPAQTDPVAAGTRPPTAPVIATSPAPITAAAPPVVAGQSAPSALRTGAGSLIDQDLAPLRGLRVGLIAHRSSVVDGRPLAELLDRDPRVELTALFAPEHGLYGTVDAGDSMADSLDPATGVPVFSLYGVDRAPTQVSLANVDVLVYDLQDVGVRFYTYTSTLGLAMGAAAAAGIRFVVLDRPNPIGGQTMQGPTLTAGLESFIGMYNVPSAYGLTSGELATVIKDQGLVAGLADLDLTVIGMQGWTRDMRWADTGLEWLAPSPNLPTPDAALIYPGTVLFEATAVSEGRGTDEPFQLIGAPWIDGDLLAQEMNERRLPGVSFEPARFTPRSIPGAAASPRFEGQQLSGVRVLVTDSGAVAGVQVGLHLLDAVLRQAESQGRDPSSIIDRPDVFDRLAGTRSVRVHLLEGASVDALLASFIADHDAFRALAADALLYPAG